MPRIKAIRQSPKSSTRSPYGETNRKRKGEARIYGYTGKSRPVGKAKKSTPASRFIGKLR